MYAQMGNDFRFVATEETELARLSQGYSDLNSKYPFVIRAYENPEEKQKAQQETDEADIVILGSAPMEYLQPRLKAGKLTFLYSERLYKAGYQAWKLPVRLWRFWKKYGRHSSLYLLCASAYTAGDFAKTGTFLNKAYKWGYFPQTFHCNIEEQALKKKPGTILWCARFLDWKHPEIIVEIGRRLAKDGYDFQIQMLGYGEQWAAIKQQVEMLGLEDHILLTGAVPAEEVRSYMDAASVFLFTSDRHEGWGAVLNESMNSGCAVVASDAIGAVPFLLKNGENGLSYRSGDVDELYEKVKHLLDNPQVCRQMGKKASETITGLWCAEIAAERLLQLSQAIMQGQKRPALFESGPCSKAEIIKGDAS